MHDDQCYDIQKTLQDMRADYWRNLEIDEEETRFNGEDHLVVQIGGMRCALRAALCREVLKVPHLVRVPRLPNHIRGIFNLRGEIIAVTDLCPLFDGHIQPQSALSRLVIVAHGPIKTALLVSAVEGLKRLDLDQIEPLADGAAVGTRDLFTGKLVESGQSLLLINLESALARPELLIDQKKPEL